MKKKIFASICLVSLASLLLLFLCVLALAYTRGTANAFSTLQSDASYVAAGYKTSGLDYLKNIRGYPGRITLVAQDGTVLFDDRQDPAQMENHAQRPEVAEAMQNGTGRSQRQSDTLGERTLYYAVRLGDGEVLRMSMQAASASASALRLIPWLLAVSLLLVAGAAGVARWQTKRILAPLNAIDLDAPMDSEGYEEIAPLLRRIDAQKKQIGEKAAELKRQQEEFAAVTQSMDEGLLLTDPEGVVLTINQSAQRILGLQAGSEGQPLLALCRDLGLQKAAKEAAGGKRCEQELEAGGRKYRLLASPARRAEGPPHGAVLMLMDDTEKLEAEQNRREFSANVSHELKTPLTSISGYAEIIRGGLVQPEDIPAFAGKIYDEAGRLIALIEDILQLSRLDEKDDGQPAEPVELLALCQNTAESLRRAAVEKQVELRVEGEELQVPGRPSILLEVVYNLLDNAIRYNRPGGTVEVAVGREEGMAVLRVADTGMGIEPQHQPHVFERFYRADKSHSRQSGGTGLGLAIVKRGVLYHGGQVQLESTPGAGSVFTVWLPLE